MIKNKMNYKEIKYLNNKYEKKVNLIASIRLITFIIMLLSYILKHYYYQNINTIIFIITLITFIILILIHSKYHKIYNYYHNYLEIIEEYIKRTNGEWKNFKDTGESFINERLLPDICNSRRRMHAPFSYSNSFSSKNCSK